MLKVVRAESGKGSVFMFRVSMIDGIDDERKRNQDTHLAMKSIVGNRHFMNDSSCKLVYGCMATHLAILK